MKAIFAFILFIVFLCPNNVWSCSSKAPQPQPKPKSDLQSLVATSRSGNGPKGRATTTTTLWKAEGGEEGDRLENMSKQPSSPVPLNNNQNFSSLKKQYGFQQETDVDDVHFPSTSAFTSHNNNHGHGYDYFHKMHNKPMTLVHFANKSIQCNDGTTAGYYVRTSSIRNSNTWIIFLEGGWFCFDERSCQNRWLRLKNLMTSSGWPRLKHEGGILSPEQNENPYWWNANHVFVPYCSSDTWSGTTTTDQNASRFSFMGALIVDEVIKTLVRNGGIKSVSTVILAGSSAGGTGVLLNLDRVEDLLNTKFGRVEPGGLPRVRGISDSGWFIDKLPSYSEKVDCNDVILCPPEISLKKGMKLWGSRLPQTCQNSYPDEPWSCFFGYRIYPGLKASLFVFQWMFDEAQMLANNVPTPALKKEEWDYVYKVGDELKKTLMNVTNVFIPACMAHTILTHRDWKLVEVNSVYLPRALKCWESGGFVGESNHIPSGRPNTWDREDEETMSVHIGRRNPRLKNRIINTSALEQADFPQVINSNDSRRNRRRHNLHRQRQAEQGERRKHRRKHDQDRLGIGDKSRVTKRKMDDPSNFELSRAQQRNRKIRHNNDKLQSDEPSNDNYMNTLRSKSNKHLPRNNRRRGNSQLDVSSRLASNHVRSHINRKKNRKRRWFSICDAGESTGGDIRLIDARLIEKCSWPQCNKSCPKLLNPVTGEEVGFKDLLKSFGLDMNTMAKALGIDLATLNNMDHQVLLQMLTQNA